MSRAFTRFLVSNTSVSLVPNSTEKMTKEDDFKLLKIQTCVLRVNLHCDGCKQKVKKLLQRIEGVYQVKIEAELQKVTVSGTVDSSLLIKKLVRAGKYAEDWTQKPNQNQKQKNNGFIKEESPIKGSKQGLGKGLEASRNQNSTKMPTFMTEEDDDCLDDEDGEEGDEDEELQFLKAANQLGLLRQQQAANHANNAKKNGVNVVQNNKKAANNGPIGNNAGKKGNNQNQNMGVKCNHNPNGMMDQKTMAALRMNNAGLGNGGSVNLGEGKNGNDIGTLMGLAGFNGTAGSANVVNPNGLIGGFQVQPNNINGPPGFIPNGGGYNNHPSSMMMMNNMQSRNLMQQHQHQHQQMHQPQMMYHRSPLIPPSTGYYYNHNTIPSYPFPYQSYPYTQPLNYSSEQANHSCADGSSAATHVFNDENTSSCSIM